MAHRLIKSIFFGIFVCYLLGGGCFAFYPFKQTYFKLSNFGEYRTPGYIHDGIDLASPSGTPVYAVKAGTINRVVSDYTDPAFDGYGFNVVIDHSDDSKTRYCHLSKVKKEISDSIKKNIPFPVAAGDLLGYSGATGNVKGSHLHFGYYIEEGGKIFAVDPVTHGLDQPNNGDAYLYDGPMYKVGASNGEYTNGIYFLTKDGSGKYTRRWYGLVPFWTAGETVRVVIEAYDKMNETPNTTTSPYRIDLKITDSNGTVVKDGDGHDSIHSINFGEKRLTTKASTYAPVHTGIKNTIYNFSSPLCTEGFDYANGRLYFYYDWKPPSGWIYKINVDVYDAYRENNNNDKTTTGTLSTPITCSKSMYFTCGLGSTHLASVGKVGMSSSGVQSSNVNVLSAAVEPNRFSPYSTNQNLPNKAEIFAEVGTGEADWTVKISDNGKKIIKTLNGSKGRTLDIIWDGTGQSGFKSSNGTYTFIVEAKQGTEIATYEGGEITIDDQQPILTSLAVSPLANVMSSTESTGIIIAANKDLYSVKVTLLDKIDNEVAFIGYIPGVFANESKRINWYWAGQAPNGEYKFKVTAVDMAGNEKTETSSTIIVNVPENTAATLEPIPQEDKKIENLPDLPPYNERPIVSALAFDPSGNQYVLYGRYNKLVKYDSAGNILKTITGVGTSEFRNPLGLAVSPSGDRVYVADTYGNRVLIYDGDFNPVKEIKGPDVYLVFGEVDSYSWGWTGNTSHSNDAGAGKKKNSRESYFLPEDVELFNGNVYVVDNGKHRLLKYDLSGEASVFSILKANLKEEARAAYNQNHTLFGQTVDKALFYSNSLNDQIIFDKSSCGPNQWQADWERIWLKEMYLHYNPSGNANGQLTLPESIATDPSGALYVADTGNNRIQVFRPDGSFAYKFGSEGNGPGQFKSPQGITIDEDNHIWVADTGNHRIQEFKNDGTFVRSWGNAKILSKPLKLVVKKIGTAKVLYVADGDKNEVQRFGVSPPKAFNILASSEALIPGKTFTLSWEASEDDWYGLKEYEVLINEVKDGKTEESWGVLKNKISPENTSALIELPFDGVWELKVRAFNNHDLWTDSQIVRVKLDATPPLPFWISYPWQDGQKFDAHDVPITWDEARDVNLDHYELVVGTDPNDLHGSAIYSNSFSPSATREVWLKDLARGKYYMYMIAYDKAGHWRRLDGKTDRPEYDKDLTYAYKDKWPMFEVGTIPPETFSFAAPYDGRIFDGVDVFSRKEKI